MINPFIHTQQDLEKLGNFIETNFSLGREGMIIEQKQQLKGYLELIVFPANEQTPYTTIVTYGLSFRPMITQADTYFRELIINFSEPCKVDMDDKVFEYYISEIYDTALYIQGDDSFPNYVDFGHTLEVQPPKDDSKTRPIVKYKVFTQPTLFPEKEIEISPDILVKFLTIVFLHKEEILYLRKITRTADDVTKLHSLVTNIWGIPNVIDPDRPPAVSTKPPKR